MDGELQAGLRGTPQRLTDLTGAQGHLAAVVVAGVVVVDVGLFDGGAGGGVAAVGEHLDAVDAQQLLGGLEIQPLAVGARLLEGDRAGCPEVDTQPGAQLAVQVEAVHGPQSVHRFGDLTDGGHSVGREQLAHASPEGVVQRVSGEPRERQEVVHLLDDAGGFPGLVPQDRGQSGDAVVGLAVVAVDAGQLQAAAVEDGDVAAGAYGDGHLRADRVEFGAGRQALVGELLVEEEVGLADQPAVDRLVEVGAERGEDVGDGAAARRPAVDGLVVRTGGDLHVGVDVDEARHDGTAPDVVHPRAGADVGAGVLLGAGGDDDPVPYGDEAGAHRLALGHPDHLVRDQDEFRGALAHVRLLAGPPDGAVVEAGT